MKPLIIALDGPSGAGKGTVARAVARELGYRHVDSGAMYRAVGWKAVKDGVALDDDEAVAALARRSRIDVTTSDVSIDGADVTRAIRTPEIDRAAAAVATGGEQARRGSASARRRRQRSSRKDATSARSTGRRRQIYLGPASADERARRRAARPIRHSGDSTAIADVAKRALRPRRDRPHADGLASCGCRRRDSHRYDEIGGGRRRGN
jgi:cytidylate kinase